MSFWFQLRENVCSSQLSKLPFWFPSNDNVRSFLSIEHCIFVPYPKTRCVFHHHLFACTPEQDSPTTTVFLISSKRQGLPVFTIRKQFFLLCILWQKVLCLRQRLVLAGINYKNNVFKCFPIAKLSTSHHNNTIYLLCIYL